MTIQLLDTTSTHYLVSEDGKETVYNRVTSVIASVWPFVGRIDPIYGEFGKMCHHVVSWLEAGTLDKSSLGDDLLKDYLAGYEKCKSETIWMRNGKLILNEAFVYSRTHKVAGRVDQVWLYENKYYSPDVKSSRPDKVKTALQTAAYAEMIREMSGITVDWRGAIELRENDYRIHEYNEPDDLDCFLCCLKLKERKSRKTKRMERRKK